MDSELYDSEKRHNFGLRCRGYCETKWVMGASQ